MTYELAKELKDAGFQQWGANRAVDGTKITVSSPEYTADYYVPSLEELIEGCSSFSTLEHLTDEEDITGWRAHAGYGDYYHGLTPSEAVAKLWINLHKK